MKRPANKLVKTLQNKKLTIALVESVTAGLATHKLTLAKGTSDILRGGITCYQDEIKTGLLKVKPRLIKKYTAESQQVTDELASGLKALINADIHAAITGLAAEGGSETRAKPVGTIFLSVLYKGKMHRSRKVFKGSPLTIQTKACNKLFRYILQLLA